MPLKADELVKRILKHKRDPDDREAVEIVPCPERAQLRKFLISGKAVVDLRLGRWLLSLRQSRATLLEVEEAGGSAMLGAAKEFLARCEDGSETTVDLKRTPSGNLRR